MQVPYDEGPLSKRWAATVRPYLIPNETPISTNIKTFSVIFKKEEKNNESHSCKWQFP